jgi:hypothetical protein
MSPPPGGRRPRSYGWRHTGGGGIRAEASMFEAGPGYVSSTAMPNRAFHGKCAATAAHGNTFPHVTGGWPPGLQNRCGPVSGPGEFDSRPPPPSTLRVGDLRIWRCRQTYRRSVHTIGTLAQSGWMPLRLTTRGKCRQSCRQSGVGSGAGEAAGRKALQMRGRAARPAEESSRSPEFRVGPAVAGSGISLRVDGRRGPGINPPCRARRTPLLGGSSSDEGIFAPSVDRPFRWYLGATALAQSV